MLRDRKINVLQVCGGGVRSGIETYVLNLARGFRNSPFNILISPLRYGLFTKELREHDIEPIELLKRFRGDPSVFFKIASIIKRKQIDIVHAHGENGNFYARIVAKLMGRKVVSTVHSHLKEALVDMSANPWLRTLIYKQDLFFSLLCDKVVAPSHRIARELERNGVNRGKITVIHSGIDVKTFASWAESFKERDRRIFRARLGLEDDEFLVGTVGRVAPVKNHTLLVEAAELALKMRHRMRFIVIGDGPLFEELKELIDHRGLKQFFILPGWQRDVKQYLGSLDAFVMTSITEGLNITLVKAMAMGIPVISTDVGSISELIQNNINGFLVPLRSPNLLAGRILELYNNRSLGKKLAERGFKYVADHFDISTSVAKYGHMYETLMRACN